MGKFRGSLAYLGLVVGAYMVGLGNIWKFPALLYQHGLGGLIVYLVFVAFMVTLIAIALESTQHTRRDLIGYFTEEYRKPALGILFGVFAIIVLGYYPTVAGWTITQFVVPEPYSSILGSVLAMTITLGLALFVLLRGREHALDVMVASVGLFFLAILVSIGVLYGKMDATVSQNFHHALSQMFGWKGISMATIRDMAQQSAYSLSLGMGFYLILGAFLPRNYKPLHIVTLGATLDTTASLLSSILIAQVLAFNPDVPIAGTSLVFGALPQVLKALGLGWLLYILEFAVFLAGFSSIIPLGEVIIRFFETVFGMDREKSAIYGVVTSYALGLFIIVGMIAFGWDTIDWFDGAFSTFVLFGGIISAWAIIERRPYIPNTLANIGYVGVFIIFVLGLYSLSSLLVNKMVISFLILVAVVLTAIAYNTELLKKLGKPVEEPTA
jgi:NSS family neurotransmitter:Na+ symporter